MKLALMAVLLGAALTALSLLHGWIAIDSVRRGFPVWFVEVFPGSSSSGPGRDVWFFRGYQPLVTNLLIWTIAAWACLMASRRRQHD